MKNTDVQENDRPAGDFALANDLFEIRLKETGEGITSIRYTKDTVHERSYRDPNEYFHRLSVNADLSKLTKTEFLHPDGVLGDIRLRARPASGGNWASVEFGESTLERNDGNTVQILRQKAFTHTDGKKSVEFVLSRTFELKDRCLLWTLDFENEGESPVEIGDVALPVMFNNHYVHNMLTTYVQRVFPQAFVAGHGSFIMSVRCNGEGPYLVMTPRDGTHLEFFEQLMDRHVGEWSGTYVYYIHSAVRGPEVQPGSWRQPHTGLTLSPAGTAGSHVGYGFKLQWANDLDAVRDVLYDEGLFDVRVAGAMTTPVGKPVVFSLRTRKRIDAIGVEFPDETELDYIGEPETDTHVYRVRFNRLGENLLTVYYGEKRYTILEFFCCQPVETLIKKRAGFITSNQCRDPDRWYHGLLQIWDAEKEKPLMPDDQDRYPAYFCSGGDDPGPANAVFLSQKNLVWPEALEIRALDLYLNRFVWGGIQRTDREDPYPGAIYGSGDQEGWVHQRKLPLNKVSRLWRSYDYTHYMLMYFNMYCIAKKNPKLTEHPAGTYLHRAWVTAMAFYHTTRIFPDGQWGERKYIYWAYMVSHHHERFIPEVIEALRSEGETEKTEKLSEEWDRKVKYALYDTPIAFGTEMAWGDPSVFSGCHAMGAFAHRHPLKADKNLWQNRNSGKWYSHPDVNPEDALKYIHEANRANVACRGGLTPAYYFFGSSGCNTGYSFYCLSYHPTIGGWALLDYALSYAEDPLTWLDLAYASITAPWALMNAGPPESGYGFWFPGKKNDGACGWAFEASKSNTPWMEGGCEPKRPLARGIWNLDGEIGHGLAAQVYAAATIVADHPLFGRIVYGGDLEEAAGGEIKVWCRDGVRQRFHVVGRDIRLHMSLDSDGFADEDPVVYSEDLGDIRFTVENRFGNAHKTRITASGLPAGHYGLYMNEKRLCSVSGTSFAADLPLQPGTCSVRIQRD